MLKKVVNNAPLRRFFSNKVGVLGVPFDKGGIAGVAQGPGAIRSAGLIDQIKKIRSDMDVHDYGDVTYKVESQKSEVPNMKQYAETVACTFETSKQVEKIIKDGRVCVTVGGDHSIGLGTVDGHAKAKNNNVCVFWIDAHADLNTNKTSGSGNIHGMPLALLVKELSDYWPYMPGLDWQKPVVSIRNVAYIGLRSVDPYERLIIDKLGIAAFSMEEVEQYGIDTVINMALAKIDPEKKRSIHVSYDIDALDPLEAPSTVVPVRGGLTLREGVHLVETIHKTGRLGAIDLVEVSPGIGSSSDVKKTLQAAIDLIRAACGHHRRGLRPVDDDTLPLQTFPPTRPPI